MIDSIELVIALVVVGLGLVGYGAYSMYGSGGGVLPPVSPSVCCMASSQYPYMPTTYSWQDEGFCVDEGSVSREVVGDGFCSTAPKPTTTVAAGGGGGGGGGGGSSSGPGFSVDVH